MEQMKARKTMYKILLVDDEAIVKISIQNMIQNSSEFSVVGSVSNGLEGLDFISTHPVDAVITDLQMPIMDGVTFVQRLRASHFRGPILALSNYSDFELVRGAMKAGVFDYLLKADISPILISEYLEKIKKLLQESEAIEKRQIDSQSLRASQHQDLFRFAFGQFLTNPRVQLQEDLILSRMPDDIFPAVFLNITMKVSHLGQSTASQFVESVLIETLSDVTPVFSVRLNDSELAVLVSEASIARQKLVLHVRLERMYRTVQAYSLQEPHVFYIQGVKSIEKIRTCYQLCSQAKKAGLLNEKPITCISFSEPQKSPAQSDNVKAEILQVLCYVNENYMNKMSLDDISAYVHLNKEYLCRLFKKETGKNLFQYICDVRMQVAANMLVTTNMPINAISRCTGFSSPYVFSKKFKEYYNYSPANYASHINEKARKSEEANPV